MKCRCGKEAVFVSREIPRCRNCFKRFFENRTKRTLRKYVSPGEKVAVAVSGGRDSLTALHIMSKFLIKKPIALVVDEGIGGYREKAAAFAKEYCEQGEIPFHLFSFREEYGVTVDELVKKQKYSCSYCGVLRRRLLNRKARELGADKLVTGHNLDDEAEAAMLNFLKADIGRMARMGVVGGVVKDSGFVPRIKPLREAPKEEVTLYSKIEGIRGADKKCPYIVNAFRAEVREMLKKLERGHPGTKTAVLKSSERISECLKKSFKGKPNRCRVCGEPCTGEVCKSCKMLKKAKAEIIR